MASSIDQASGKCKSRHVSSSENQYWRTNMSGTLAISSLIWERQSFNRAFSTLAEGGLGEQCPSWVKCSINVALSWVWKLLLGHWLRLENPLSSPLLILYTSFLPSSFLFLPSCLHPRWTAGSHSIYLPAGHLRRMVVITTVCMVLMERLEGRMRASGTEKTSIQGSRSVHRKNKQRTHPVRMRITWQSLWG